MKIPHLCKDPELTLVSSVESLSPYETYSLAYEARRTIEGQHLSFLPTKAIIFDFFDRKISRSAIQKWDDQYCVMGKYCIVNLEPGGVIDQQPYVEFMDLGQGL